MSICPSSRSPYLYGHAFEVDVASEEGDVNITKWYAMGRHSYELWKVMPDNKVGRKGI